MTIVSKIEIKLQFPYVVQAQYEHRTAIYNTNVHKNKSTVALNVANVRAISYRHQHATRAVLLSRLNFINVI